MMKHKLLASFTAAAAIAGVVPASVATEAETNAIVEMSDAIAVVKTNRADKKAPSLAAFREAAQIVATETAAIPIRRASKKPMVDLSARSPLPEDTDSVPDVLSLVSGIDFSEVGTDDATVIDNSGESIAKKEPPVEEIYQLSLAATREDGWASWYGPGFHGNLTANGEIYDQNALTAAHRTLPFGTRVRVTNLNTGLSVVVRINDRGPFVGGRIIDLSAAAATSIGMYYSGTAPVQVDVLN